MFFIVFIHELGHTVAAVYFKWQVNHISILPFGGELSTNSFGHRSFKEEMLVILAGPIQHFILFFFLLLMQQLQLIEGYYFEFALNFNWMILITNLLPIWPLDGGKLLFLLLTKKQPFRRAHRLTIQTSLLLLILFMAAIIVLAPFHLNSWLFSGFLLLAIRHEWKQRQYFFLAFLLKKKPEQSPLQLIVHEEETVMNVLEKFYKNRQHYVVVLKDNQVSQLLEEKTLLHALFTLKKPNMIIKDIV